MPVDDTLRYDQVSFKASHNTYDHGPDLRALLDIELGWDPARPSHGGCRGLEFDIIAEAGNAGYCVKHEGEFDDDCLQLSNVLSDLAAWSMDNPGHDVIHVSIDIKRGAQSPAQFAEGLDAYILRAGFDPDRLYRPGQLLGDRPNLWEAVRDRGWPTLGELRGKFIFCLSGDEEFKRGYAETRPAARLCFADRGLADNADDAEALHRLFVSLQVALLTALPYTAKEERRRRGVLLRAYSKYVESLPFSRSISNKKLWNRCLADGFAILATDRIAGTDWATVGPAPFRRRSHLQGR